jgi:hypothetical protein
MTDSEAKSTVALIPESKFLPDCPINGSIYYGDKFELQKFSAKEMALNPILKQLRKVKVSKDSEEYIHGLDAGIDLKGNFKITALTTFSKIKSVGGFHIRHQSINGVRFLLEYDLNNSQVKEPSSENAPEIKFTCLGMFDPD